MTDVPVATVARYIAAFNAGDVDAMAATFAPLGVILDGMAPHLWQGATAPSDWYNDVLAEGEAHGASDYVVTLGEPLHADVTDDRAYVVAPASMTFTLTGTRVQQTDARFTVALEHTDEQWRILAWAWAKGAQ